MNMVLGCLRFILETSAGMSPNVISEKDVGSMEEDSEDEDLDDPPIDLDTN